MNSAAILSSSDAFAAKRKRAETRFRLYGLAAIGFAVAILAILLSTILLEAQSAFSKHRLIIDLKLSEERLDPDGSRDRDSLSRNVSGFHGILRETLEARFPEALKSREQQLELAQSVTNLALKPFAEEMAETPSLLGSTQRVSVVLSDEIDLYLKGRVTREIALPIMFDTLSETSTNQVRIYGDFSGLKSRLQPILQSRVNQLEAQNILPLQRRIDRLGNENSDKEASTLKSLNDQLLAERARVRALSERTLGSETTLTSLEPSVLLELPEGVIGLKTISETGAEGLWLTKTAAERPQKLRIVVTPEANRALSDQKISWIRTLDTDGQIKQTFNTELFTHSDSNYPELAGTLAAVIGSVLTMLVTMFMAVPIGVLSSIYLEEFSPRNRFTDLIEVNINNLAAVPSIVFGLLGAALFIKGIEIGIPFTDWSYTFGGGLSRGWPLVGGMVLALMTLPTVIISSRAALRAVPQSTRDAALGLGASKMQMVFHHVLPTAAPGILTGSIIGLAQALGETAPLLLIGMFAFVAEAPAGPTDQSTVLPVLIYKWASNAERAWEPMTSAAILILLVVMIVMNALAVVLRRHFEGRS